MVSPVACSSIITPIRLSLAMLLLISIVGFAGATPAQATTTTMQSSTVILKGDVMRRALTGELLDSATTHEYSTTVGEDRTLAFGVIALSPGLKLNVQVYRVGESQPSVCSRSGITDAVVLCYRDKDDQGPLDNNPNRVQVSASEGTGRYIAFARAMGSYAGSSNPKLYVGGDADSDSLVAGTHKAFLIQAANDQTGTRICLSTANSTQLGLIRARAYNNQGVKVCELNGTATGGCATIPANTLHYVFTINDSTTQVDGVRIWFRNNACS